MTIRPAAERTVIVATWTLPVFGAMAAILAASMTKVSGVGTGSVHLGRVLLVLGVIVVVAFAADRLWRGSLRGVVLGLAGGIAAAGAAIGVPLMVLA